MTRETFLQNHREALGQSLGIEFAEIERERVVATLEIGPQHVTEFGAVQGGVVMAIADIAGALGAVVNLPDGYVTSTLESKSNFLKRGRGRTVWAESTPIHLGRTTSVWRTQVFRGDDRASRTLIAEVVQTQLNLPEQESAAAAPRMAADEPPAHEAAPATSNPAAGEADVVSLADVRKRQILAGACDVMMRKGFAKASVREIADAAGMPIPTMYKYVRSKEDILALVYENFLVEFQKQLDELLAEPHPPERQLALALDATVATFDKYHEHVKLLFRETKSLPDEAKRRVYELDCRYVDQWRRIISEAGVDRRLDVDADLLANFIYYLTTVWPMRHWAIGKWSVDDVRRAMSRFVMAAATGNPDALPDEAFRKPAASPAGASRAGTQ